MIDNGNPSNTSGQNPPQNPSQPDAPNPGQQPSPASDKTHPHTEGTEGYER
jgi:hypothetical protein